MLYFKDFSLTSNSEFLAMQYDNETRRLEVFGDFPAGWSWEMMVTVGDNHDILPLEPFDGGVGRTLTRDNLSIDGLYDLQLRGTYGEKVQHTNQITVQVLSSQSGDANWPEIPTSFSDAVERAENAASSAESSAKSSETSAKQAEQARDQYPKIINGNWWIYDPVKGEFVDTGIYSGGDSPYIGSNGNWYVGDRDTGVPATGSTGLTPQISVTVETLPSDQQATVEVTGTPEAPEIHLGIPQGAQGERGQQGIQGVQGWSVSAAALDDDGALVLTIRNPADGSTQTLPPVAIDNSAALQAVAAAITAQGTTQVQRVEDAGDTAVGAVSTATDAALQAVDQAQTSATGAVSSAKTTAVQAVQTAQGTAEKAIGAAQTAAVEAVEAKGTEEQGKLNAIVPPPTPEDAGKALIANEDGTGLVYGDAPGGAGIDDAVIATNSTWSSRMIVDSLAPEFNEAGAVVTCNPVAGYPLSIQAQIVPVQEGSGDPSPENVRPISGWDAANLWVGGKNLVDYSSFQKTSGGSNFENNNGVISVSQSTSGMYISANVHLPNFQTLSGETITITAKAMASGSNSVSIRLQWGNKGGTLKGSYLIAESSAVEYETLSVTGKIPDKPVEYGSEYNYLYLCLYSNGGNTVPSGSYLCQYKDIQIEYGSTATPYEPYRAKTITRSFGQTIYGGTLDVGTGMLTVTWGSHKFNADDRETGEWQGTDTSIATIFKINSAAALPVQTSAELPNILCTSLKTISYSDIYGGVNSDAAISLVSGGTPFQFAIRLPLSLASSANDIKNWLIDNNVEMVYKLADPIIIQLTPQEILALPGVNTIYSDTGNVTVSGRADPNAVIQQLAARIAALESAAVANA